MCIQHSQTGKILPSSQWVSDHHSKGIKTRTGMIMSNSGQCLPGGQGSGRGKWFRNGRGGGREGWKGRELPMIQTLEATVSFDRSLRTEVTESGLQAHRMPQLCAPLSSADTPASGWDPDPTRILEATARLNSCLCNPTLNSE